MFRSFHLSFLAIFLFLSSGAFGAVWIVGPGGHFSEIQDAVDAASHKDTILVKAGTYSSVSIKSLEVYITVDNGADVVVKNGIVVKNLTSDRTVLLCGLKVDFEYGVFDEGLTLGYSKGSIRIEDCEISGANGLYDSFHFPPFVEARNGVWIEGCDDVAFTRCTLKGGDGDGGPDFQVGDGMSGIYAQFSTVALYDCLIQGGTGGDAVSSSIKGGNGGSGYASPSAFLFASGCEFNGGDGGRGGDGGMYGGGGDGGDGGHGIHLTGASAETWLLDNLSTGGLGGPGGAASPWYPAGKKGDPGQGIQVDAGSVNSMSGAAHTLDMPSPVREMEAIALIFKGEAGDLAGLLVSAAPGTLFVKALGGQVLVSLFPMPYLVVLGVVPGSGTLKIPASIPDMGVGFSALTLYFQSIFAGGAGSITLGSPRTLVILDDAY